MRRACDWFVPKSISVTYDFANNSIAFSESDFPEFNWVEANCPDYRIKRVEQIMGNTDPRSSPPWALAMPGPDALVMGYLPIDPEGPFQTFAKCKTGSGLIPVRWTNHNPYCYDKQPFCSEEYELNEIDNGLGALPSIAQFHQRCINPECPDPPDPENPNCDYLTANGIIFSGIAGMWNPIRKAIPTPCISAGMYVDFSYTPDPSDPESTIVGTAILRNGSAGECYRYDGTYLGPVTTTIDVQWE